MVNCTPGVKPKLSGMLLGAMGEKGSKPWGKFVIRACAATLEAAVVAVPVLPFPWKMLNACMKVSGTAADTLTFMKR